MCLSEFLQCVIFSMNTDLYVSTTQSKQEYVEIVLLPKNIKKNHPLSIVYSLVVENHRKTISGMSLNSCSVWNHALQDTNLCISSDLGSIRYILSSAWSFGEVNWFMYCSTCDVFFSIQGDKSKFYDGVLLC